MLGVLEVVEYSLNERFNIKYLNQVSYLRLQHVIGVCLSYCCPSGTTCVLVIVQYTLSMRYKVYTCHSPRYHYIIVTVVYLVHRIIAACVLQIRGQAIRDDWCVVEPTYTLKPGVWSILYQEIS